MRSFCGIVHQAYNQDLIYLPLEKVEVEVKIVDTSAHVNLIQIYNNPSTEATSRAKYVFPVPARAAVCAFDMRTADGRLVIGECKAREEAAKIYETAISQGKDGALVEWATDDAFTISIGSIPAKKSVTTRLSYVIDLREDENPDQVRFYLPMAVGQRYGTPPPTMLDAHSAPSSTRVSIDIVIQASGQIHDVHSPTHGISLVADTLSNQYFAKTAKFRSPTFLNYDFVLVVRADGLDTSRCFAELDPRGTVAMHLTLVPKFDLPKVVSQEYIFVVDRSGSMSGRPIETAKSTLTMLLRMLPSQGTSFNIFSFGSTTTSFWRRSISYGPVTLNQATNHVAGMGADYGGTEILTALHTTLTSRNMGIPTAVFVLTDGEAYDIDPTIKLVQQTVAMSSSNAPLRVFTLGIGTQVSTAMCEGIARAGNGACLMATSTESIVGKCSKLLRAGRVSSVTNASVDWGVPVGMAPIRQSPASIGNIYPGIRFDVFAILGSSDLPREVVLRGKIDGPGNRTFELTVPVTHVSPYGSGDGKLVHSLAARRLITDLEEDKAPLHNVVRGSNREQMARAEIVRLGERYQLASRYTSFIAVEPHPDGSADRNSPSSFSESLGRDQEEGQDGFGGADSPEPSNWSLPLGSSNQIRGGGIGGTEDEMFTSSPPRSPSDTGTTGDERGSEWEESDIGILGGSDERGPPSSTSMGRFESDSEDEVSDIPARVSQSNLSDIGSPMLSPAVSEYSLPSGPPPERVPPQSQPLKTGVVDLVKLQSFDGSFQLDGPLRRIIGSCSYSQPPSELVGVGINKEKIWATALAIAFLKKNLVDEPELLEGLMDKAMEFVDGLVGSGFGGRMDFGVALGRAEGLLA
ncbi:hypothetical protein JAAARDRAFT_698313 [Jaapia argillacea MUCL 33604]|uniref:VIT domain-containing protein n=1 Tax=Jaapia argillacea MUCL 33604 TaxID=933084 RepID=A0A067PFY6_9AGAM|nr:hypothetical protein JAAARDRAFT_698313 [Jaapia argillacea MUCL 33604]